MLLLQTYGQTFIDDDYLLAVLGSLASVCNAGGRIVWGHLADKTSFRVSTVYKVITC